MTTLAIGPAATGRRPSGSTTPASLLARLARAIAREWRIRRGAAELRTLDARMLRDVGLDRGEVAQAARFGRL